MTKLSQNLHVLVFIWGIVSVLLDYVNHSDKKLQLNEENKNMDIQLNAQIKKKKLISDYKNKLSVLEKRLETITKEFKATQDRFPSEISDSNIKDIAAKLKLNDFSFNFQDKKEEDFYLINTYQLKSIGTFLQFLIFFEQVKKMDSIINIKSLSLTRSNKNLLDRFQYLDAMATVEIYGLNKNISIESLIDTGEEGQKK